MKSTINRKVYDIDTATLVAGDESVIGTGDFQWWAEALYLTAKGSWFLFGRGGGMTLYADHQDGHSSEGEKIIPMSRLEALAWCEEHHAQEAIDQHFADLIADA
ncbi:MAG: hypothetical protein ABIS50_07765 [Luteolibacter sp.]|uniref:hypothetical protein n=1 Tax=Luteolibacter sp. TaxID=1962973 RepID=UPI003267CC7F